MSSVSIAEFRMSTNTPLKWLFLVFLVLAPAAEINGQQLPITALSLLPSGQLLTGSDDGLWIHDETTLKPIKRIATDIEKIYSIRISPDQTSFAISGGTPAELGVVEVFSTKTFDSTHEFGRFNDVATDCVWISQDQLIACSMTGNCCLMPLSNEKTAPFNVHSKGILGIAVLSSGNNLVTAGLDNTIGVWEMGKHKQLRVLNNHVDVVNQIAARPSVPRTAQAMMVSVSDDATVRFWHPKIGRMVRFARLDSIPTCVVWNRAGTRAVVGSRSGQVYLVDPAMADVVQTVSSTGWINCLALSPDEKSVLIGGESGLVRLGIPSR